MTPQTGSLAPWSTTTGDSEAQGEHQTQTYEAHSVQRLRGRRSPWQEEQGVFVPGHPLALPLV